MFVSCRKQSLRHMKPGLRGRYPVQSLKSRVDINSIGKVMRIPCSSAILRAAYVRLPNCGCRNPLNRSLRKVRIELIIKVLGFNECRIAAAQ
jgi:hypothetical protein